MFNLENEIKNWKKSFHKYQSMEDGYCDELESHLREIIDKKLNDGVSEEEAFNYAKEKVGNVEDISGEYYSSSTDSNKRPPWKEHPFLPSMITSYFKIARRQLIRNKGYSFINIVGLSVGLACMIILVAFIKNELSYDDYFANSERLYRVYIKGNNEGQILHIAPVMLPFAPAIKDEIPELEAVTRLSSTVRLIRKDDKVFVENMYFVDEDMLNVFSFELISGDRIHLFDEPNKIVLSEDRAKRYFGDEPAVGQTLVLDNKENFVVSGVIKNPPPNIHFRADVLASILTLQKEGLARLTEWSHLSNDYTYVLLSEKTNPADVEKKFQKIIQKYMPAGEAEFYGMSLQKLKDVHFSSLMFDDVKTISVTYLYIFGIIAFFILLVACINFINLSTARATRRSREVGVRKTIGAGKSQLIFQFLSEAVIYVFISFVLAFILVYAAIPEMNSTFRSNIEFAMLFDKPGIIVLLTIFVLTSLIAGAYPAFIMSRFLPVTGLKGNNDGGKNKSWFREILVVAQFTISVFLILGTIIIYNQIDYLINRDLGFDSDKIGVVPLFDETIRNNVRAFSNSISALPEVESVSISSGTPASGRVRTMNFSPEGKTKDTDMQMLHVDHNFKETYGLKLIDGRFFNEQYESDKTDKCLINKSALERIGWQNALGKTIKLDDDHIYTVIGIVNDFNYGSLKTAIDPLLMLSSDEEGRFCSVKFVSGKNTEGFKKIEKIFSEFTSGYPFEGYLMDREFRKFYGNEERIGQLVTLFAGFAIFISCLGILGLVSFMTEQKKKEIGIRKILGASVITVLRILGLRFIKWIVIANVIAWPLSFSLMEKWLLDFAYHIKIDYAPFIIAGAISMMLAVVTISYHVAKAALSNPVDAMKYE